MKNKKLFFGLGMVILIGVAVYALFFLSGDLQTLSGPEHGRLAYLQEGNLWVKELPDGKAKQLVGGEEIYNPRWSPSGKWLLFQKDNQIWLSSFNGSTSRLIASKVMRFGWSPVQDKFVYSTLDNKLFLAAPDTKDARLLPGFAPDVHLGRLVWSGDGRYVVFERFKYKNKPPLAYPEFSGIWKVDIASGKLKSVYESPDPVKLWPRLAGWSASGQENQIFFWLGPFAVSIEADGLPLYTINEEGGEAVRWADCLVSENGLVSFGEVILLHPNSFIVNPSSDHHGQIALIVGSGRETWKNKQLALLHVQTNKLILFSKKDQAVSAVSFSPDGESLVYSASPEPEKEIMDEEGVRRALHKRRLWLVRLDDRLPRPLTNDDNYCDEYPLWSADGNKILFARLDNENKASLWLMQTDGSNSRQVVAELSPDHRGWFGYYGYIDWPQLFDYWGGPLKNNKLTLAPEERKRVESIPYRYESSFPDRKRGQRVYCG
ncbi:MAG TPA: hypothetical protein DCK87_05165 [Desulfotomaculum sp.]|nr:hypothetical protein [Desulfotomaculum sp.]